MSNPVEIVARYLREAFCVTAGFDDAAQDIIAALEKEDAKVVFREPTEEMRVAYQAYASACLDEGNMPTVTGGFTKMFDAAPRYGDQENR